MNKLLVMLILFIYSSGCKEGKNNSQASGNENKDVVVQDSLKQKREQTTQDEDYKNVLIEDPENAKDGEHFQYYKSGNLKAKGSYRNGKRDGHWTVFYESGLLWSEADYKDGKKSGKATVYYPGGQKRYEGTYESDKRVGVWRFYDKDGHLIKEENQ